MGDRELLPGDALHDDLGVIFADQHLEVHAVVRLAFFAVFPRAVLLFVGVVVHLRLALAVELHEDFLVFVLL